MATHWRVEAKNSAFYCTFLQITEFCRIEGTLGRGPVFADVRLAEGAAMVL